MKIFIAGTFDNFHVGHQYLLWKGYYDSDKLIIIIARDETVKKIKGVSPKNNELIRLNRVKMEFKKNNNISIKLGNRNGDFIKTLKNENPDILFLGYDQAVNLKKIKNIFPKIKIKIIKSYFPQFFKSSKF